MARNVGGTDRAVRAVVGLAIGGLGLYAGSWWGAVGLLPLLSAGVGWCPAYVPLGMSTCGKPASPPAGPSAGNAG